jgi:hypothetical protein
MRHTDTGEHAQRCDTHQGHQHRHGADCGHKAIPHEDHVDYQHDGHLHRAHGDHFDECAGAQKMTA